MLTTTSARTLPVAAAAALLVSGAVHLQQFVAGYSAIAVVGPLFLVHALAAAVLGAWVVTATDPLLPAVAGIGLELGALGSLAVAFLGSFFGTAESGLRPATMVAIVSEVAAVGLLALLLGRRSEVPEDA